MFIANVKNSTRQGYASKSSKSLTYCPICVWLRIKVSSLASISLFDFKPSVTDIIWCCRTLTWIIPHKELEMKKQVTPEYMMFVGNIRKNCGSESTLSCLKAILNELYLRHKNNFVNRWCGYINAWNRQAKRQNTASWDDWSNDKQKSKWNAHDHIRFGDDVCAPGENFHPRLDFWVDKACSFMVSQVNSFDKLNELFSFPLNIQAPKLYNEI